MLVANAPPPNPNAVYKEASPAAFVGAAESGNNN